MRMFCRYLVLVILVVTVLKIPAFSAEYLELINSAVTKVEAGSYDDAAVDADNAISQDNTDPLGHYIMAAIYLHTGGFASAEKEIAKALAVKPDEWRGHYALALIDLHDGKYDNASKHLSDALKDPNSEYEVRPLLRYFDYLSGKPIDEGQLPFNTPLDLEVFAMNALRAGKTDDAMNYFKKMQEFPEQLGFVENRSPIASFDSAKPIIFPYVKLKWRPESPKNASVVSGVVTLKGDAKASSGIKFVSVYIDDAFVGISNTEPFEFRWDTSRYTNGLHQVKMVGKNMDGLVLNSKTIWVMVKNEHPYVPEPKSGKVVETLMDRIWNLMRVAESRLIMHYQLAKLYIKSGDTANAIKELQIVQAYRPGYLDSLKLLKQLENRQSGFREIYRGPQNVKKVALTFDDGPNERTQEMLDMLKKLDVPATFFIVGYVAETEQDMVRKIYEAGHEIENHSYSHRRFNTLSDDEIEPEITKCAAIIKSITGHTSTYFRPPGGHSTEAVKKAAARQGITPVFWTIMCSQYEGEHYANLADHVLNNICNGAIILMHNGEPATTSALAKIVPDLRARGYQFVRLDDLLKESNSYVSSGIKQ